MANDNQIEFTVRLKEEGLGKLADGLERVESSTQDVGTVAATTGDQLDALGQSATAAEADVEKLAAAEDQATEQARDLGTGAEAAASGVAEAGAAAVQATGGLDRLAQAETKAGQDAKTLGTQADAAAESVADTAAAAEQAGSGLDQLANAEGKAATGAKALDQSADAAEKGVDGLGKAADTASAELAELSTAVQQKTQAIRSGLAVEQSEIELQRQHLVLARDEQQAALRLATARGDDAAATRAQNQLRTIESSQLALTARSKRAEADAIQQATNARREELAALGPLTAAQTREIQTAENHAKALRVQAAAADQASQRAKELGTSVRDAGAKTEAFPGTLTKVASAIAGAFAVGRVVEFGKSVNEVADSYKNLEARVRLALGVNGDLAAAVQGVGRVAMDTYSNLDATSELYGRLVASSKELNITNTDALGITKTINQSIQVGGASAQASEASVRQLVQALQSGVLRGDEFNSIMEQAPRLAKALADGLGVPVGALRGMAEAGEITSARVVKALKGQADAVNKEFSTLPLTTGRALENLNTQWTLFIGNLTGGAQQSGVVAQGINALAQNLDTLANVAARGGAVLTAALAIQGVAALRTFATEMATTGKAATLMSLELSKVPKVISITVAAVGFEVGFQIGEMLYENSELARKLGVGITAFMQNTISDLILLKDAAAAVFTSDTIDAAFERYRVRGREMDAIFSDMWKDAEQAPTKIGAAADAAAGKAGTMGAAAQAAGTQVAQAGAAGAAGIAQTGKAAESAAGAMSALLAAAAQPVAKANAATQIAADLVEARKRGVDLDALMRKDLPEAIGKLSGAELVKFRQDFTSAMQLAGETGKALQTGLRLIGEQAAQSLGVDVTLASDKASAGFTDANDKMRMLILSLPALKAAGIDTGLVVGQALSKMIDGAKNQAEVDAIRLRVVALRAEVGAPVADGLLDQLKQKSLDLKDAIDQARPGVNSLREAFGELGMKSAEEIQAVETKMNGVIDVLRKAADQGTITGDQLAEGLAKAQQKIDEIKPGINSIAEAMKTLGVTSQAELQRMADNSESAYFKLKNSATATNREISEGFKKFADDQIKANEGVATEWLKQEAAVRGYKIALDEAGKATVTLNDGRKNSKQTSDQVAEGYAREANGLREIANASREAEAAERSRAEAADAAERKRLNIDKEGFSTDKDGNRIAMGGDLSTLTGIAAFLKAAGVDDEAEARRIAKEFANEKGQIDYINNAGQIKYGGRSSTMSQAVLAAAEKYTFSDKNNKTSSIPSQTQTINININGKNTPVTVATANDANALRSVIDQLTDAAGRS